MNAITHIAPGSRVPISNGVRDDTAASFVQRRTTVSTRATDGSRISTPHTTLRSLFPLARAGHVERAHLPPASTHDVALIRKAARAAPCFPIPPTCASSPPRSLPPQCKAPTPARWGTTPAEQQPRKRLGSGNPLWGRSPQAAQLLRMARTNPGILAQIMARRARPTDGKQHAPMNGPDEAHDYLWTAIGRILRSKLPKDGLEEAQSRLQPASRNEEDSEEHLEKQSHGL
ncbi:hypothetical protein DFH09DRAFT_1460538 [Mycena vulgaris]|nr:hypothetical protein DFH09DRAFT_1460538 [Mycena vulgaris]